LCVLSISVDEAKHLRVNTVGECCCTVDRGGCAHVIGCVTCTLCHPVNPLSQHFQCSRCTFGHIHNRKIVSSWSSSTPARSTISMNLLFIHTDCNSNRQKYCAITFHPDGKGTQQCIVSVVQCRLKNSEMVAASVMPFNQLNTSRVK
jgi:hypothetical protein